MFSDYLIDFWGPFSGGVTKWQFLDIEMHFLEFQDSCVAGRQSDFLENL